MSMARSAVPLIVVLTGLVFCLRSVAEAAPRRPYFIQVDDPDNMMEVLSRLSRSLIRANAYDHSKRGVDFGLGRGFSGTQAAKHLMGLAAANYAVGPGRKKRGPWRLVDAAAVDQQPQPDDVSAYPVGADADDAADEESQLTGSN